MAKQPDVPEVLCARRRDVPRGWVVPPGVGILRCVGCGAKLVAARSTLGQVARGESQPVCPSCFTPGRIPAMSLEQLAEYAAMCNAPGNN